ncbi:MAG TPA: lysylphosphatidylglycerol synthase domain-containing protein [Pyrinomonadaceae bacterium]|nr:lysylphosphatidylglycerol synthase domain-containing protein [Pyrinomonadaceae bacterium]
MIRSVKEGGKPRRLAHAGVAFAVAGLALFVYFVWRAGPAEVWSNISKIGWGFAAILLLAGLRFVVRALAWTLCFEPPHRLGFWDAFSAYLIGDSAGNIVPLGIVVSEPTKAALVGGRVPFGAGFSAIAVENIFYMLSTALFIFCGAAALLASFQLPNVLRYSSYGVVAGALAFVVLAAYALRRQLRFLTAALDWTAARGLGRRALERRREKVASFEDRIYGFYEHGQRRFAPILLCEFAFHMLGVAEAFITIALISGTQPSLLSAFLFESVNRIITVAFKFVPLRAGIDELGTGQLARVLAFGMTAGVTLAVVRKARTIFWMAVGVLLLASRGLSIHSVAEEAERAKAAALGEQQQKTEA